MKSTKINLKKETMDDEKTLLPSVSLRTGHKIEFEIGQIVYLKTDNEQHARMVTGINLRPNGCVTYCLSYQTDVSWHYAIEIDDERDIVKMTSN